MVHFHPFSIAMFDYRRVCVGVISMVMPMVITQTKSTCSQLKKNVGNAAARFLLEAAGAPPTKASAAAGARTLVALIQIDAMILGCAAGSISMPNFTSFIGQDMLLVRFCKYLSP